MSSTYKEIASLEAIKSHIKILVNELSDLNSELNKREEMERMMKRSNS
jgi:hypothetical protein